jgi:hypothetical protein
MKRNIYPIVPMTLGNMRQHGVRPPAVACSICHHEAIISAEPWPDDVPVPTFRPRMVCTRCVTVGADARPNWREHRAHGAGWPPPCTGPPSKKTLFIEPGSSSNILGLPGCFDLGYSPAVVAGPTI